MLEDAWRSFENRIRLTLEVLEAVQSEWPINSVVCSYFGYSWADGGWNAEESVQLSIQKKKVDLIDVSSGALVPYQKIPVAPNYQFAEQIKKRKRNQLEL
jgi:2,4-dienoyl-CoA reductase-like NADH-dependent reductase (Old Yellow Enzyme family)